MIPHFAYHTGRGFTSRPTACTASQFERHQLSPDDEIRRQISPTTTPLVTMEFKENDGAEYGLVNPLSYARIDARLYKFIVEMQFGIMLSLHRDFMGSSFFLCGNFRLRIPGLAMRPKYAALSGRPSCSGNQRIGLLSIRAGSTVRQGLA